MGVMLRSISWMNTALTSQTQPNGFVPPIVDCLRRSEIERRVLYVDEFACRNSIAVNRNDSRTIYMQVMLQNILAALESIKVPRKVPRQKTATQDR